MKNIFPLRQNGAVGENIVLPGSQAQPEHKAHWAHPTKPERFKNFIHLGPPRSLGPNLFSRPDYPTRIPIGTNIRVYLGSTQDLGDTTHDIRLDHEPGASPMSCRPYKIECPRLAVMEPGISVRLRPRLRQLPIYRNNLNCSLVSINTKASSFIKVR
jgi:hypothetical protein